MTIKYAAATSSTGADPADWSHLETVIDEGVGSTAGFTMAIVNGNPAISFRQSIPLKYAYYQP